MGTADPPAGLSLTPARKQILEGNIAMPNRLDDPDLAGEAERGEEQAPATHDPDVERRLDHGLEETFPASDPVSISPSGD